ncbi:hypothetical protein IWW40_001983 [Coemansia sp. RSA 1250]|nr:hypothetical protein IWW40_001983 [Coemansia sp. RSA 1250]
MASLVLSPAEQDFITRGVEDGFRADGRGSLDRRQVTLRTNMISQANGSARCRMGHLNVGTDVLVGIKAEVNTWAPGEPDNVGSIVCNVECSPSAAQEFEGRGADELNVELTQLLDRILNGPQSGICLDKLCIIPKQAYWVLHVDALVLDVKGGIIDALVWATRAALLSTKLPRVVVESIPDEDGNLQSEFDVVDDAEDQISVEGVNNLPLTVTFNQIGKRYVVDASEQEEAATQARITVAVSPSMDICAVQKSGILRGFSSSLLTEILHTACKVAREEFSKFKDTFAAALSNQSPSEASTGTMTDNGLPANYSLLHPSAEQRFSVRGLPPRLHLDRIYMNGLHALVPFWLTNETGSELEISLSTQGPLKIQQHNPNWSAVSAAQRKTYLDVAPAASADEEVSMVCSATIQREFSEIFNQLDGEEQLVLEAHESVELVLLFIAHSKGSTSDVQSYEYVPFSGRIVFQADTDTYTVKLRASACKSVLDMDPPTSRIYVDDCVIGRTYERVLCVRNMSAIGLDWTMTVVETTDSESLSSLQLLDSNMQESTGGHLNARSDMRVLVRYTAHATGEFLCRFLIENSNDPANNTRYWVFRARVSQRQKPRRIELLSDPDISFGNCTSGVWYSRDISFKNISDTPVLLRFRVEGNTAGVTMRTAIRADNGSLPFEYGTSDSAQGPMPFEAAFSRRPSLGEDGISESVAATDEIISEGGSTEVAPADDSTPPSEGARTTESGRRFAARARAVHQHKTAMFDELLIKPGSVRTMVLALVGNPASSASVSAGQFGRQSFTLFCECSTVANVQNAQLPPSAASNERNVERLSIPCTVNMCTPFVRVSPALLDFGSVDVGTLKSLDLQVENLSQVAAVVQCKLESKVITCTRTPITIAPLQTVTVRVDIYPRRINARYRKQIIVRNIHNRFNDNVIEVRSTHVDRRRVAYHNMFYHTLVPNNEQNFVDFGPVPVNSRSMRKINLQNVCRCPLNVEVVADTAEFGTVSVLTAVKLYDEDGYLTEESHQVARRLPLLERQAAMHSSIEKFKERTAGNSESVPVRPESRSLRSCAELASESSHASATLQPDMFIDKSIEQGHVCLIPFMSSRRNVALPASLDYLDVASVSYLHKHVVRIQEQNTLPKAPLFKSEETTTKNHSVGITAVKNEVLERASQILDEIVEKLDMAPQTLFSSPEDEDAYVRRQVDLHKYIDLLIESGFLQPAQKIELPPLGTRPIIVMLQPAEAADKPTPARFDANLYFRLEDRPSHLQPYTESAQAVPFGDVDQLPVRRFLIQAALFNSELEIGQKNINVGNMQVDESSRKYLVIQNRSETPLMYAIRKTGSIASGDIRFVNNRYGVVRGFDSRKVVFVFSPSLNGVYNEQISIANVLNARGGKYATLKAAVRRPSKFYIRSLRLDFAADPPLALNQLSAEVQLLAIKNMTAKTRRLVIKPLHAPFPADGPPAAVDQAGVVLEAQFPEDTSLAAKAATEMSSSAHIAPILDRETEEKIESLEQKLKIAIRKNRPEKIEKYRSKLAKLRSGGKGGKSTGQCEANPAAAQIQRLADNTQLAVELPPGSDISIPVAVVARSVGEATGQQSQEPVETARGMLAVHEEKDNDNVKVVTLTASVANKRIY